MSHLVGSAIVHAEVDDSWAVTSLECAKGLVSVDRRQGLTRVVVGDTHDSVAGMHEPPAFSAAAFTSDGEFIVVARRSPPAIAMDPTGSRITPAGGATLDSEYPEPGRRFLLLSCAAFEDLPEFLATGLERSPSELISRDAEDLLLCIFADHERGAGAVIDRLPPRPLGELNT